MSGVQTRAATATAISRITAAATTVRWKPAEGRLMTDSFFRLGIMQGMGCDLDWLQEPIALADDGLHKSRRVGVVIERPPDFADDCVDRCVLVDEHVAGPELGAQILARDQCPASLDELDERVHRQPLELHEPGAGAQGVRRDVELEPAEAICGGHCRRPEYRPVHVAAGGLHTIFRCAPWAAGRQGGRMCSGGSPCLVHWVSD